MWKPIKTATTHTALLALLNSYTQLTIRAFPIFISLDFIHYDINQIFLIQCSCASAPSFIIQLLKCHAADYNQTTSTHDSWVIFNTDMLGHDTHTSVPACTSFTDGYTFCWFGVRPVLLIYCTISTANWGNTIPTFLLLWYSVKKKLQSQ